LFFLGRTNANKPTNKHLESKRTDRVFCTIQNSLRTLQKKRLEKMTDYLFTVFVLIIGFFVSKKLFFSSSSSKKKTEKSGLHREIILTRMVTLKQHVLRDSKTGSSLVRPSEGSGSPADDLVDYSQYPPPYVGTSRDYVGTERKSKKGMAALPYRTLTSVFQKAVKRAGDRLALKACTGQEWTWNQYYEDVCTAAKSLISLGFQSHDCINILGFNSPEWIILNTGAIAANGMAAGVYTTNLTEACEYIASHSKAKVIAVENLTQLEKYIPVAAKLTNCKSYIVWAKDVNLEAHRAKFPSGVKLYSYKEFMALGKADASVNATLDARLKDAKPTSPCTLIYTSGTTGNPKAVSITHDNCVWTSATTWANLAGDDDLSDEPGGIRLVSYLPLSHIAAQMLDVHAPLFFTAFMENSCSVHFADANALKGTLLKSLQTIRPTHFFGVPRVWEKFQAAMVEKGKNNSWLKKQISAWARGKGMELLAIRQDPNVRPGSKHPAMWVIAKKVLTTVREAIGFDRCRICLTGAAPINRTTLEFFASLDIPVLELYGMSECTGPTTMSHLHGGGYIIGSCGMPLAGTEIRIDHMDGRDKPGEGEICFRGRHIMAGYLDDPAKTTEAIDNEGWLHSGDVGRVDDHGMLYITGRIKELLIGSGGENVAPVPVEARILQSCQQGLANFVMIGDRRKFFVALATPRCVPNPDGSFSHALDSEALKIDPACTTAQQASKSKLWRDYVQAAIDDYNKNHAVSHACKIAKFEILPNDFSVPTEELGPTLKLKRNVVNEKYKTIIDAMYPADE
jgi:long-chain-fatty-acid--CoA ligase ACSBG